MDQKLRRDMNIGDNLRKLRYKAGFSQRMKNMRTES